MRAFLSALVVTVAAALAGCGDTLVDHRNVGIQDEPPVCSSDQATCLVGSDVTCPPASATQCGASCENCTISQSPPEGATAACLRSPNPNAQGSCGWECTGGLLKCASACCAASVVVAGAAHTCAITSGGGLACWGDDSAGQVSGAPPSVGRVVTTPLVRYAFGVTAVAAGAAHTCAVVVGVVACWGRNLEGQAPETVSQAEGATALAAGTAHTCALVGDQVRCWGSSLQGQAGGGTPVSSGATALSAGAEHTCALLSTGAVVCWGTNAAGELGTGTAGEPSATPVTAVPSGMAVIGAGDHHTCAATGTKTTPLFCWGANPSGAAGGLVLPGLAEPNQATPAEPLKGGSALVNFDIAKIDGGRLHTCVQKVGESVKCFGADGEDGQLGAAPIPNELHDIGAVPFALTLAVGGDHGCAVKSADGSVHCWGRNSAGQLGDGTLATPTAGTVVPVSGR